jgi:hypothetical protein
VPMFTWGFVRSNLCLPICVSSVRSGGFRWIRSGGGNRTRDTAIMSRLLYL